MAVTEVKFLPKLMGGHVHVRVFVRTLPTSTWASSGELVLDKEEWERLCPAFEALTEAAQMPSEPGPSGLAIGRRYRNRHTGDVYLACEVVGSRWGERKVVLFGTTGLQAGRVFNPAHVEDNPSDWTMVGAPGQWGRELARLVRAATGGRIWSEQLGHLLPSVSEVEAEALVRVMQATEQAASRAPRRCRFCQMRS